MEAALTDSAAPLLIVNNIEVVYDHVILVLKGVSLEVPEGGIVALLGANGAGKTTTLKSISNLLVARGVLRAGKQPLRSAFVHIPLALRDPHGLAALSMITTVVPGTVWSELALDRSVLLVHVFELDDEAAFIQHFKDTYERPLMEIFQ